MTFEKLLENLASDRISAKEARDELISKDKLKTINLYVHRNSITKDPLKDGELIQLKVIVEILQILYNSGVENVISDSNYDILQETLVDMGVPRLSGSYEINDNNKVSHQYTNLRGTLNKVYYLFPDQKQTNKSRKYLDDWIKSMESKYEKNTGKKIKLNDLKVLVQPKYDGTSVILEIGDKKTWITRGDTGSNRASDVTHIMNIFNDLYSEYKDCGIKFEVMISENNKDKINDLSRVQAYKNSRQIVTAVLNSKDPDFKADYLYPIPLRITYGDGIEKIHPDLISKFPTKICKLSDRDEIKEFASKHKLVECDKMKFRTDGAVITILDEEVQKGLGRDNNINNFEVAYKFTAETAHSRVKDCIFELSEFGYICPVIEFYPVVLKGNTVQRASLSNKERFDELDLHYGDTIKIEYDIIPYITIDDTCIRSKSSNKIEFTKECPKCGSKLDLTQVQVQCTNENCPSIIIGRILNYCKSLRIDNIGYQTLETLYSVGLIKNIRSLYKLHKKTYEMEELDGFGTLKTKKIIAEIESKRRLKDYELLGSIGIESLSVKTFQSVFSKIKYHDFINMIMLKNFELLHKMLIEIDGMGPKKSEVLITYFKEIANRVNLEKLLKEISIQETYDENSFTSKGRLIVSGFRPSDEEEKIILDKGYEVSDSWSNKAKYLIIPDEHFESNKVDKAKEIGVPILYRNEFKDKI